MTSTVDSGSRDEGHHGGSVDAPPGETDRARTRLVDGHRSAEHATSDFEAAVPTTKYPDPPDGIDPDQSKGWIARLRPVLATHRLVMIVSLTLAALAMAIGAFIPLVTRNAIDQALDDRTATLSGFVIGLIALGLAKAVLTFAYRYGLYGMAFRIEYQLRTMLHVHLSKLSFAFFDRVQSGQIISRANSDIRSVQMFLTFAPMMAIQVVSFSLALVIMFRIDVTLTIVAMVALPGVFVFGQKLRQLIFPISWIVQSRMADVATVVDENINGVRVVKSFAAEERQVNVLADSAYRLRWAQLQAHYARAKYNPIIENIPRIGLAFMLLYGGLEVIDGNLSIGDLVAFNLYIVILQAPFRFLGMILMMSQRAKASAERIFEVLDEQPGVTDRPGAFDLVDPVGRVGFESVSFTYGTETIGGAEGSDNGTILEDFDLDIAPGQRVAIVGRTGSGKSTVARLLLRFYDVQTGRVLLDGNDVRDLTGRSVRHAVGLVPDEPFLFSCSVHENIAYARPDASRDDVVAAATAANADRFIRGLENGYDTVVGERGYDLSGGQRQRIAIARTLLANPRVLVLDDATSAIDVQVEAEIHDALLNLMQDRTTIIIAHRLSTIALAERVVLLEGGRIIADGTHQQLLAEEPRYAAVLAATESIQNGASPSQSAATGEEVL